MALMTTIEQPATDRSEQDKNSVAEHAESERGVESEPAIMRRLTPELGFDLVRIYLGFGLAVRGLLFLLDPSWISEQLHTAEALVWPSRLIALGHLSAGLLLALGYYTRIAAAVQLVPVLGAVLLVHRREGLVSPGQSLEFAALVFAMLLFYTAFGAGRLSLDHRLRRGDKPA
jgi:putative oxidoreductase